MAPFIGFKITNFLVLLMSLILTYQQVIPILEGRMVMESLSSQEDELERQLRILNKPPIKSIHALWGDIYDCIEFNKQPAFDHPLLKNHKSETREEIISITSSKLLTGQVNGCPKGTVPIRRTTREDLIRAQSLSSSSNAPRAQCRAGVSYDAKQDETIYGARGGYNAWNPMIKQDQFSSAEITLQSGSEVVKSGWIVDPQLYGDYKTRGYIYWTADGGQKTGCYNTFCRGFVQVHDIYTPDAPFGSTSIINGTQVEYYVEILLEDGKWWLILEGDVRIGYWPTQLFQAFGTGAKYVYWGGRVQSGKDGVGPPMGSGQEIDAHSLFVTGYVRRPDYIDKNYEVLQLETYTDINDCKEVYTEKYFPDDKILKFGGHGGTTTSLCTIEP